MGENRRAVKKIAVASITMAGPEGMLKVKDRNIPRVLDRMPAIIAVVIIPRILFDS